MWIRVEREALIETMMNDKFEVFRLYFPTLDESRWQALVVAIAMKHSIHSLPHSCKELATKTTKLKQWPQCMRLRWSGFQMTAEKPIPELWLWPRENPLIFSCSDQSQQDLYPRDHQELHTTLFNYKKWTTLIVFGLVNFPRFNFYFLMQAKYKFIY